MSSLDTEDTSTGEEMDEYVKAVVYQRLQVLDAGLAVKFLKEAKLSLPSNMESNMLEHHVELYRQTQGSRADRKLALFDPQSIQEKTDQVGSILAARRQNEEKPILAARSSSRPHAEEEQEEEEEKAVERMNLEELNDWVDRVMRAQANKRKRGSDAPKPVYVCPECPSDSKESWLYPSHFRTHVIDVHFRQKVRVAEHQVFACAHCHRKYAQVGDLNRHMKVHSQSADAKFTCSVCGRVFDREHKLEVHMNTHNKIKPYQCSRCGGRFQSPSNLSVHLRKFHNYDRSSNKENKCQHCGQFFPRLEKLEEHNIEDHGELFTWIQNGIAKDTSRSRSVNSQEEENKENSGISSSALKRKRGNSAAPATKKKKESMSSQAEASHHVGESPGAGEAAAAKGGIHMVEIPLDSMWLKSEEGEDVVKMETEDEAEPDELDPYLFVEMDLGDDESLEQLYGSAKNQKAKKKKKDKKNKELDGNVNGGVEMSMTNKDNNNKDQGNNLEGRLAGSLKKKKKKKGRELDSQEGASLLEASPMKKKTKKNKKKTRREQEEENAERSKRKEKNRVEEELGEGDEEEGTSRKKRDKEDEEDTVEDIATFIQESSKRKKKKKTKDKKVTFGEPSEESCLVDVQTSRKKKKKKDQKNRDEEAKERLETPQKKRDPRERCEAVEDMDDESPGKKKKKGKRSSIGMAAVEEESPSKNKKQEVEIKEEKRSPKKAN